MKRQHLIVNFWHYDLFLSLIFMRWTCTDSHWGTRSLSQ
jgi:hypothetical protein